MLPDPLLTTAEVARLLGVTEPTVREYCEAGQLTFIRVKRNGPYRIHASSVERLCAEPKPRRSRQGQDALTARTCEALLAAGLALPESIGPVQRVHRLEPS